MTPPSRDEHRRHPITARQQVGQLGRCLSVRAAAAPPSCLLSPATPRNSGSCEQKACRRRVRSRGRRSAGEARQDALHIADLAQQAPSGSGRFLLDGSDGALATFEDHPVADRQAASRLSRRRAHGVAVHRARRRGVSRPPARLGQLQIAAAGGIHDDRMIGLLEAHAANVGRAVRWVVFHVPIRQPAAHRAVSPARPQSPPDPGCRTVGTRACGRCPARSPTRAAAQTAATLDMAP